MRDNVYIQLTREFNVGRTRAMVSSGQAVVLYRLALMSKDGDWILREDEEATGHVLAVLSRRGAKYRFGAPLDARWLAGGWSAHFEFQHGGLRVRCDFVTRPPRVEADRLESSWRRSAGEEVPVVELPMLADLKKTNREKDYAVIGELARLMEDPAEQLLHSRSARDLLRLAEAHGDLLEVLQARRPALAEVPRGRDALERALDEERRGLMRANELRLARYLDAAQRWRSSWPALERELSGLDLLVAHRRVVERAEGVLPFGLPDEGGVDD